jgi:rhamnose utilization protein RhaD (predicted bifunctional aldolase and dehydrogenase)/NAD(P)-dependent dehydrogenase (short-subunit alcohol dehydrogenase family)
VTAPGRPWPSFEATASPLQHLLDLSHYYGSDPRFVLAGGGNTSVKLGDRLFVKASGYALATIGLEGIVELDREALQTLLESTLSPDPKQREEQFKTAVLAARVEPQAGRRPSVEAVLHHLIPNRFVVHTHPMLVNTFSCARDGAAILDRELGDQVLWIDPVDPGFLLAKTLERALDDYRVRTGREGPRAVIMGNHGLVVSGETPAEIRAHTDWLFQELERVLAPTRCPEPFGAVTTLKGVGPHELVNAVAPALRALLSPGEAMKVVTFDDSPSVMRLAGATDGEAVTALGPLCPDQIVYCKSFPLWFEDEAGGDRLQRLTDAVGEYRRRHQTLANVVVVKGLGLFAAGDTWAAADAVRQVYKDAIEVMTGAAGLGGVRYLGEGLRRFIEEWEVESYRREVASSGRRAGRVAGKVALVTGAAQGFGLEIAQDLVSEGAHVALADVNEAGAQAAAGALSQEWGEGRAMGFPVDVATAASVDELIHQVVRAYGGLDLLVSNAGVLRAASVKTQAEHDFDLSTAVNYKGYFLCVQKAIPVMAVPRFVRPDYWSDIIQINSKSGLVGSEKNFAYAGSKFGGVGLTQSFALELVADGIKVNSVCPGNFLDGPLWSDPNTGLFVQYLNTGKVPGARTVEDVKRYYTEKVPMRRGCTTADVMKAIYYLVEQEYETGQALPVTGGQVMLH